MCGLSPYPVVLSFIYKPYITNHITGTMESLRRQAALWHGYCPTSGAQAGDAGTQRYVLVLPPTTAAFRKACCSLQRNTWED
jgi:hypothetical protein